MNDVRRLSPHRRSSRLSPRNLSRGQSVGIVALAIAVSYGAGFVFGSRDGGNRGTAPPTAPTSPRPASTSAAATDGTPPTADSATDPSHSPNGTVLRGRPVLANDDGWGLYVAEADSQRGDSTIRRIDLSTGDLSDVPGRFANGLAVLTGSGAAARLVSAADVGGARQMSTGPDGDLWVVDDGPVPGSLRLVRPGTGGPSRTIASYDAASLGLRSLEGSTAEGTPVFRGADGTSFVLDLSGASKRVTSGALLTGYDHGNYAAVDCDDAGTCVLSIHGGAWTQTMPYERGIGVSISPDGSHALAIRTSSETRSLEMLDLQTGAPVATGSAAGIDRDLSMSVAWTPDGAEAFVLSGRRIVPVRVDGATTADFPLPDAFLHDDSLIGIA